MPGRKIIFVFCLICFASSASREQQPPRPKPASNGSAAPQAVAPPPKPPDNGPSLEVTMKFIQDKMNGIGPYRYSVSVQEKNGNTQNQMWTDEVTNVVADPKGCAISYHSRGTLDDTDKPRDYDFDFVVNLKEAEKVTVQLAEQYLNDLPGNTTRWTFHPPIFQVMIYTSHNSNKGGAAHFYADDEELANRLARAITHAIELCTPDKKPEPF